jgi:hypothetical protein
LQAGSNEPDPLFYSTPYFILFCYFAGILLVYLAGGSEAFGAGVTTGFSLYSGALGAGAAALDPKSEHGLIPHAPEN